MQSITDFKLLNKHPVIRLTTKTIQAIRYIVSIAPEEAQWFHTVSIDDTDSDNLYIDISEKLYIPKQNTSLAQVDTNSSMMIEFYNELKEEYQDQQVVNQKLNSMTCWCHSHHNMEPSPSSQDIKQFNFFVKSAMEQNQHGWHLMLIFNKKNHFYAKAFDTKTLSFYEGLSIHVVDNFDFSYIDKAAKEKFIKPKRTSISFTNQVLSQHDLFNCFTKPEVSIADDFFATFFPKNKMTSKVKINQQLFMLITDWLIDILDEREIVAFRLILENKIAEISNVLDESVFQTLDYDISEQLDSIYKIFKDNKPILASIRLALIACMGLDEFKNVKAFQKYLRKL